MIRIVLALFLALGIASASVACGASGDQPKPSGGLGY
jgi:hypothetical protein